MARLQIGVVRYGSTVAAIERAVGGEPLPRCQIGHGRIRLTFRGRGASHWPERQQLEYAFQVAALARGVLSADSRRSVRERVTRAIVVVYEDSAVRPGCTVKARWECVVMPAPGPLAAG